MMPYVQGYSMANFCAFKALQYYGRSSYTRPTKTEALDFIKDNIAESTGSCLFFGDRAAKNYKAGMIYDIAEQLPEEFSFSRYGKEYGCKVFLSPPYRNYNSGNTVKHCIIQWTKKRIPRNGAKKAPRN